MVEGKARQGKKVQRWEEERRCRSKEIRDAYPLSPMEKKKSEKFYPGSTIIKSPSGFAAWW